MIQIWIDVYCGHCSEGLIFTGSGGNHQMFHRSQKQEKQTNRKKAVITAEKCVGFPGAAGLRGPGITLFIWMSCRQHTLSSNKLKILKEQDGRFWSPSSFQEFGNKSQATYSWEETEKRCLLLRVCLCVYACTLVHVSQCPWLWGRMVKLITSSKNPKLNPKIRRRTPPIGGQRSSGLAVNNLAGGVEIGTGCTERMHLYKTCVHKMR